MSATTIKLDHDLVEKVTAIKPRNESISAYVRRLIEREHRTREHQVAAREYRRFLEEHPGERADLDAWESASLVDDIEPQEP